MATVKVTPVVDGEDKAPDPQKADQTRHRRQSIQAVEARDDGKHALSAGQVKLKYDTGSQTNVVRALAICVLFDMTGGVFLMPAFPQMVSSAKPYGNNPAAVHEDAFPDPGISYAVAIAMFMSIQQLGQACSNLIFPPISDKIGRKPIICLFTIASLCGHIAAFSFNINKDTRNYWLFVGIQFWMGLFGGTGILAITYVNDLFPDPIDAGKKVEATNTVMAAISMSINFGSLVGFAIVRGTDKLYYGSLIGVGCSTIAVILAFWIPGQMKSFKQIMEDLSAKQEKVEPTPYTAKKAILLIMFAMVLDSIGSQGLNTIRQNGPVLYGNDYMDIADVMNATQIFAIILGVPFAVLIAQKSPGKGPVHACVLGNLIVGAWQFGFLGACDGPQLDVPGKDYKLQAPKTQTYSMTTFIVFVYSSALFNVWSMLQNDILVQSVAPPDKRGYWGGLARLAQNLTQAIAGICWPTILGNGTDRFSVMLIACASVSILGGLAYTPQYIYYIPPSKEKGITAEEIEGLIDSTPEEFAKLDYLQQLSVFEARVAKGRTMNPADMRLSWGDFKEETSGGATPVWKDAASVRKVLAFQNQQMIKIASDRHMMEGFAQMQMAENKKVRDGTQDALKEEEKIKMGKWLGDMLDSRGYDGWYNFSVMYKIMLSNAFPTFAETPIAELDEITVADVETNILGAMKVMDMHGSMSANTEQQEKYSNMFKIFRNPGGVLGMFRN